MDATAEEILVQGGDSVAATRRSSRTTKIQPMITAFSGELCGHSLGPSFSKWCLSIHTSYSEKGAQNGGNSRAQRSGINAFITLFSTRTTVKVSYERGTVQGRKRMKMIYRHG
ncbi:Decarboxylase DEC1 [Fusarium oxysporum f. sp. albedinis]|nr:Decarboxylase DEC1 [Fusarium oxysporum f. sp. albedinis]